jgi:hypothetical protein
MTSLLERALILWLSLLLLSSPALAIPPVALAESMKAALVQSPDHFISALIEYASQPICQGDPGRQLCFASVKVVEQYAARRPDGKDFPNDFSLYLGSAEERIEPGARALVLAVPLYRKGPFKSWVQMPSPDTATLGQWALATATAIRATSPR